MAIHDAAFERPFLTLDGEAYLATLASPVFYELVVENPLTVVADLPIEWEGSSDLVFTWDTIQLLLDDLLFSWTEVGQQPIAGGDLVFTWIETDAVLDLVFSWIEIPAGLLDAYELDPQRPYGRVTKP